MNINVWKKGTLIRRHRIPKPANENGQHFIVSDLNVGQEITFYSKTFKITGCDKFTRVNPNQKNNLFIKSKTRNS